MTSWAGTLAYNFLFFRSTPSLPADLDDVNLPWKERRLPAYISLNNSFINDESQYNNPGNPVNVPGA